jgi:hypothetical protein
MKGGRFTKLKKPSGFTGKKPGDRAGSIYDSAKDAKSPKKAPAVGKDAPAPEAKEKPAKKGGILAIGISGPKPPVPVDDFDESPMPDPLMDEMPMGGPEPMGMPGMEEGGGPDAGIKRFFADAAIEKLMRLQR